jgi:large subunit ribosomal protein L25
VLKGKMTKITFNIDKRSDKKNKAIRRQGKLPANFYQAGEDSVALEVDLQKFNKLYQEAGDTNLVYLTIDGDKKTHPSMIDDVQYDHLGNVIHVIFRGVKLTEKITANIPVELVGEFDVDNSDLVLVKDEVEVEALPTDFPESFVIDQSKFTSVEDSVTLADLEFDQEKVTLVLGEDENPEEITVVAVQEQREEEVEEAPEEMAEPELVGDEAKKGDEKTEAAAEESSEEKAE